MDWAIPAAYVTKSCEVLNGMGQTVRVVQPAKSDTKVELEAARTRVQAAAEAAQLDHDTFCSAVTARMTPLKLPVIDHRGSWRFASTGQA